MKRLITIGLWILSLSGTMIKAEESPWSKLLTIIEQRSHQIKPKMRLSQQDAKELWDFIQNVQKETRSLPHLQKLQHHLPKVTVELFHAIKSRGVSFDEAESMADYLLTSLDSFSFKQVAPFDENTSHIIGRDWEQIDYSGEGMTWQNQKKAYLPFGVLHFKSTACLKAFLARESTLPYFQRLYQPKKHLK